MWGRKGTFLSHSEVQGALPNPRFIIEAGDLIGRYGHRLRTHYRFDPATGHRQHHSGLPRPPFRLADLFSAAARPYAGEEQLAGYLDRAREILGGACPDLDQGPSGLPADFEELREFHLPPACVASEPALVGAPV